MDVGRWWRTGAVVCTVALVSTACGNSREGTDRDDTIPRITGDSTTSTSRPEEPATTAFVPTTAPTTPAPRPEPTSPPATNAPPQSSQPRQTDPPPTNAPQPDETSGPTSTVVVTPDGPAVCSEEGIGSDTGHLVITNVSCHGGWAIGRVDECPTEECEGMDVFHVTEDGWVHDGLHPAVCAEGLAEAGMSIYTAMAFVPTTCEGDPGTSEIIRPGSEGDRVRHLQIALVSLGYDVAVDGTYGARTQGAVRDFQSRNGLEVDGISGPRTQAALGIGPDGGTTTPGSTAAPSSTSPGPSTSTAVGPEPVECTAEAIGAAIDTTIDELYACRAGWAIGLIEACPADTICEQVDVFHITENGWVHDGVHGSLCAEDLVEGGVPPHTAGALGTYCGDEPPARTNILPGSTEERVTDVQVALVALGHPIAVDGTYGAGTEQAVRDFQAANNLEVDGIAGPATQEALGL